MMALIEAYTQVRRFPPSWRELMRLTGMRSTNSVNDHLKLMKLKGLVRYDQKTARSTVLTDFGREVVETCDSKWP
jgi:SOS-response transcriptional repressor LexA